MSSLPILLLIGFVVPGLIAQRAKHSLVPKPLEPLSATAELGEFVGISLVDHLVLASAYVLLVRSWFPEYALSVWECFHRYGLTWAVASHYWLAASYVFISLPLGYVLGLIYGWVALTQPLRRFLTRENSITSRFLRLLGIPTLLVERPIVYDVFDAGRLDRYTFLELEMKDERGFYSGLLAEYALVPDQEPHKLVYLQQVQYRATRTDVYEEIESDGMLLDLADVLTLRVRRPLQANVEDM